MTDRSSVVYYTPTAPFISLHPGMMGGDPVVNNHRMPVEQVAGMWANGNWTVEQMAEDWPGSIDYDTVVIACWYMARYGPKNWKKAWKGWLGKYEGRLWKGEERCPLPPRFLMGEEGTEAKVEETGVSVYDNATACFFDIDTEREGT